MKKLIADTFKHDDGCTYTVSLKDGTEVSIFSVFQNKPAQLLTVGTWDGFLFDCNTKLDPHFSSAVTVSLALM